MIAASAAPASHGAPGVAAPMIPIPLAGRPACLPDSIAFSAAQLPVRAPGDDGLRHGRMGNLHASLPPELEPAVGKRRIEFLAGRLCAGEAARRLGRPLHGLRRGADGAPIWPAGLAGSIAHSDRIACAAVAEAATHPAIGIDIEPVCSAEDAERLAPMIFAPGERAAMGAWSGGEEDIFTLAFSLKEAIYKCIHPLVRRFVDFHEVRLVRTGETGFAAEAGPRLRSELRGWRIDLAADRLAGQRFTLSLAVPPGGAVADGA